MIRAINSANHLYFVGNNHQRNKTNDKNPVSKTGEASLLTKATFFGGLAVGARLLFELFDDGFLFEVAEKKAGEIVEKTHKQVSGAKKTWLKLGAFAGLLAAAVAGFALLYTAFNAPKIAYNSKINSFKKGKDMDVYISANKAEQELYSQLNDEAQNADDEDKQNLKEQYAKLKLAKNEVPDWIELKK